MLGRGLTMKRWNNFPRIEEVSHLDNLGFVMHVALFLTYLEEKNWKKVDKLFIIKRLIFSSFNRLVLADINSGTREYILSLDKEIFKELENKACYGNTLLNAFEYLYVVGTCTEQCIPYKLSNISKAYELPLCETVSGFKHDMCSDFKYNVFTHKISGTPQRLYRALRFYGIPGTTKDNGSEHNIRYNLYVWGPVATGMKLYSDFYKFDSKNTIYEWDKKSEFISGHAVSIIGWGEDNGKKYWLIRNSWGVDWGIKGYFKIIRGQNECELEENCMSVVPDFFYPHGYISKMISNNNSQNTFVTLKVDKDLENKRNTFKSDTKILGSGVEQEIGYSRNYIAASPWANLAPPIQLSELPDWGDFIAGKHYPQSNIHTYINTKKVIYTITIALVIYIIISMYK